MVLSNWLRLFLFSRVLSRGCGFNIGETQVPDGSARASNKRWLEVREPGIPGRGLKMMRSSLAVAVVLAGLSVSGLAQQNNKSKVKPTHEKAAKQSAPLGKTAGP